MLGQLIHAQLPDLAELVALVAGYFLVYRFPRFSAAFVGPSLIIGAAIFFATHLQMFFFFPSDGSAAGLIVPILCWVVFGGIAAAGVAMIREAHVRLGQIARGDAAAEARHAERVDILVGGSFFAFFSMLILAGVLNALKFWEENSMARCAEDSAEVAFVRALPEARIRALYEEVRRRDELCPDPFPTDCTPWLSIKGVAGDVIPEFADLNARYLNANPPGRTRINLKTCGDAQVDLFVYSALLGANERPRVELRWGSAPNGGGVVLWSPFWDPQTYAPKAPG